MDGNKTTKILHSLIDNIEEIHSLWVEEKDQEGPDILRSPKFRGIGG